MLEPDEDSHHFFDEGHVVSGVVGEVPFEVFGVLVNEAHHHAGSRHVVILQLPDPQPVLHPGLPSELRPGFLVGGYHHNVGTFGLEDLEEASDLGQHVHLFELIQVVKDHQRNGPPS